MLRTQIVRLCLVAFTAASLTSGRSATGGEAAVNAALTPNRDSKYALLIGCSEYVHLRQWNLRGPPNDVREFNNALVTRFAFPAGHVRQLVGWPDDVDQRPTRANILREFQALAERISPGAHVVVYMSGHGVQIPIPDSQIDPLDPKNPEPDGFDEAFVAADARHAEGDWQNLILDDEIGRFLDTLRAKDAHVWALFDCCHSGTMAKGTSNEQPRQISARDFGVPEAAIRRAREKAKKAQTSNPVSVFADSLIDSTTTTKQAGTQVEFYAAQPFETAPDLLCPESAVDKPENYFGLLTYTTLQTLLQQRPATNLTYRELGQLVINRYRADRGSSGPTPRIAGDVDREVLGFKEWPGRSHIVLKSNSSEWSVNAGELQGLMSGSILKVFPPAIDGNPSRLVGHVRVTRAQATIAVVEPFSPDSSPAIAADELREFMRCEVLTRHLGDLRIRLSVGSTGNGLKSLEDNARTVLQQLSPKIEEFVEIRHASAATTADWQLLAVTPEEARQRYQLSIIEPRLLLVRLGEMPIETSPAPAVASDGFASALRAYQSYDPANVATFGKALQADLFKIFTYQNLWRIAGRLAGNLADSTSEVIVEVVAVKGLSDNSPSQPFSELSVNIGEQLELRVKNDGTDRVWVTPIFLGSNFDIKVLDAQQLARPRDSGDSARPIRFEVGGDRPGTQAWLVIASSAEADREEPDFRFLAQSSLGKSPRAIAVADKDSQTPFQAVAHAIAGRQGIFRGDMPVVARNPTMVIRSWQVRPWKNRPSP